MIANYSDDLDAGFTGECKQTVYQHYCWDDTVCVWVGLCAPMNTISKNVVISPHYYVVCLSNGRMYNQLHAYIPKAIQLWQYAGHCVWDWICSYYDNLYYDCAKMRIQGIHTVLRVESSAHYVQWIMSDTLDKLYMNSFIGFKLSLVCNFVYC